MRFLFLLLFTFTVATAFPQSPKEEELELLSALSKAKEDTAKVNILNELSLCAKNISVDKSTEYAYKAIELAQKSDFKKGLALAYLRCANSFYYKYEFDSALVYAYKNLELNKVLGDLLAQGKAEINIGLFYHNKSEYMKAIEHYSNGLKISEQIKDNKRVADVYHNIGAVYYDQGNFEKALDNYYASLRQSEKIKDSSRIFKTLGNIGGVYNQQNKNENAAKFFAQAYSLAKDIGDARGVATTAQRLGSILSESGYVDSAMVMLNEAIAIYDEMDDVLGVIMVKNRFGILYENQYLNNNSLESLAMAEKEFTEALELNQKLIDDVRELIVSYQGLGEVKLYRGELNAAIKYLSHVRDKSKELDFLIYLSTAYEYLIKAYKQKGDFVNAFNTYEIYKSLEDSLKKDQNVELLTQMSMQHEFDKQQEIQQLEYEQKRKRDRMIRGFILSVLVIVVIFSIQVLRSYQRKKKDNILLEKQKNKIEKQNEEIKASIHYAQRIQRAIVPSEEKAQHLLKDYFLLWKPRDIVSGDFWWVGEKDGYVIATAADCTGHGVPGAFMSMLGVSFLNEIVNQQHIVQSDEILNHLREKVKETLGQTGEANTNKDGMDMGLMVIDFNNMKVQFSGAYNPLFLYRKGELMETKATRNPIAVHIKEKPFEQTVIDIQKGDTLYVFSDGFPDQFGGDKEKKYSTKRFKEYLGSIQKHPMETQKVMLDLEIEKWMENTSQVDDIIILGIKI